MTIKARPLVQVALSLGPNDTPSEDDWTDLSDRVLEFTMDRGRDDRTQSFDPGTCTVLLDNDDRDLDPLRTGSLVELEAGKGLPLCPIRVIAEYDGAPRIFTGYIGPEPWVPLSTPVGGKQAVRLQAYDRLAVMASAGMPSSPFAMQLRRMDPDWWIRGMLPTQIVASAATEIADSSGNGYDGVVSGGSGVVYNVESLVSGDDDSALGHEASVSIYTDASALTVAKADVTMCCVWRGVPAASDQEIMRQRDMGSSTVRWRVECQTTGDLVAIIYGAGGTPTDLIAAPANPNDSGGRWDDDEPHIIFLQIDGGTRMRIRVDSTSDSTTVDIPSTVAGRVIFGGGVQGATFDEVAYWNRLLSNTDVDRVASAFMGTAAPFDGDSLEDRLERWWDTTNHPRGSSDLEVHLGTVEVPALRGIESVPSDLAEALRVTVESHNGVLWATREGAIRARTLGALSNATSHDADYIEPVALLTDVADPDTDLIVVRRSQPEFTGPRLDRVINVFRITIGGTTYEQRHDESIARYGERVRSWTSEAWSAPFLPPVLPETEDLADVADPSWDVGVLTLWPLIDSGAAEFVFNECELERAVDLQWTDGGIVFTTRLQVQGESWTWKGGDLQVDLRVGRSVGAPTITEEFAVGAVFLFATEDRDEMTAETGSELTATI